MSVSNFPRGVSLQRLAQHYYSQLRQSSMQPVTQNSEGFLESMSVPVEWSGCRNNVAIEGVPIVENTAAAENTLL